jgi:hypothetical protein
MQKDKFMKVIGVSFFFFVSFFVSTLVVSAQQDYEHHDFSEMRLDPPQMIEVGQFNYSGVWSGYPSSNGLATGGASDVSIDFDFYFNPDTGEWSGFIQRQEIRHEYYWYEELVPDPDGSPDEFERIDVQYECVFEFIETTSFSDGVRTYSWSDRLYPGESDEGGPGSCVSYSDSYEESGNYSFGYYGTYVDAGYVDAFLDAIYTSYMAYLPDVPVDFVGPYGYYSTWKDYRCGRDGYADYQTADGEWDSYSCDFPGPFQDTTQYYAEKIPQGSSVHYQEGERWDNENHFDADGSYFEFRRQRTSFNWPDCGDGVVEEPEDCEPIIPGFNDLVCKADCTFNDIGFSMAACSTYSVEELRAYCSEPNGGVADTVPKPTDANPCANRDVADCTGTHSSLTHDAQTTQYQVQPGETTTFSVTVTGLTEFTGSQPADIMYVLDKSGSMQADENGQTKIKRATDALNYIQGYIRTHDQSDLDKLYKVGFEIFNHDDKIERYLEYVDDNPGNFTQPTYSKYLSILSS